jgi:hypothetical protein
MLDRFDVQIVGFAIPSLMSEWGAARGAVAPAPAAGLAWMRSHFPAPGRGEPLVLSFFRGQIPLGVSVTMLGYFKRCWGRSLLSRGGPLLSDLVVEGLGDRAQPGPTQRLPFVATTSSQGCTQGEMHQHHHPGHRMEPTRPDHIAIISIPV